MIFLLIVILFFLLMFLAASIRIVREYERGVIFRLGRLKGAKGPGLFFVIPVLDNMVKIDLRIVTHDVPSQEVITKDNVPVRVNAVVYYRVMNPEAAVVEVEHYRIATSQIAQTTVRSVVGQHMLDDLLSERDKINKKLQVIIDDATDPWGIKVTAVEIKDVELPAQMQRAMAKEAEAERERRARIIQAEGEKQAAVKLSEAATTMEGRPEAIYLRTLQTIAEATSEKASTVILPIPMELLRALSGWSSEKRNVPPKQSGEH
jgi:regulator of protease activity HflC (stomatin/prohibitin superfamily)